MGISGSGKTTVGTLLAQRLTVSFVDADSLHSQENIAKMTRSEPLVDEDRWPWLKRVADQLEVGRKNQGMVIACSALRKIYRDAIRRDNDDVFFVHLAPHEGLIATRLHEREGHFMPPDLLSSQLAILEGLSAEEWGTTVDSEPPVAEIVDYIVNRLRS